MTFLNPGFGPVYEYILRFVPAREPPRSIEGLRLPWPVAARTIVMQQKTQRPVQFEITEPTRKSVLAWIRYAGLKAEDYLFPSRIRLSPHLSTRQYARIVETWVTEIGLDAGAYGTHTMRRTKASLIYRRTKNLPVGHDRPLLGNETGVAVRD